MLLDVTFTVEPGQMVALVGPSGAGKTTISQLVPRLYDVDAGAMRINGVDVREASFASLRDAIGVVTQDAHLFHDTIRANLLYAKPDATDAELAAALRGAQIRRWSSRCPTASTPWSATAATACPAARSSAWPSPGCC